MPLPGDLGEGAVGHDERGPGSTNSHSRAASPSRVLAEAWPSVTAATPSIQRSQRGRAAVGADRADVGQVGDLGSGRRARCGPSAK